MREENTALNYYRKGLAEQVDYTLGNLSSRLKDYIGGLETSRECLELSSGLERLLDLDLDNLLSGESELETTSNPLRYSGSLRIADDYSTVGNTIQGLEPLEIKKLEVEYRREYTSFCDAFQDFLLQLNQRGMNNRSLAKHFKTSFKTLADFRNNRKPEEFPDSMSSRLSKYLPAKLMKLISGFDLDEEELEKLKLLPIYDS